MAYRAGDGHKHEHRAVSHSAQTATSLATGLRMLVKGAWLKEKPTSEEEAKEERQREEG